MDRFEDLVLVERGYMWVNFCVIKYLNEKIMRVCLIVGRLVI